jgi:hypothetical protein
MSAKPHWLFVAYGGGHVRMLLPVARRVREQQLAHVEFLALTTARAEAQREGFDCIGYKDLHWLLGPETLRIGRELLGQLEILAVDKDESEAYLGINYEQLQAKLGADGARAEYARYGRQAFDPQQAMASLLARKRPALVVATSSPRSERAVLRAARGARVRSACLVDLFALDEIAWVGRTGFADRVCVLNEAVRTDLVRAGRNPDEVVVTGNPAFDACTTDAARTAGAALRQERNWPQGRTVLFASAPEPAEHPFRPGAAGNPELPRQAFEALQRAAAGAGLRLLVRPHPSEAADPPAWMRAAEVAGQDIALETLVNAVDLTVVLVSTVAIQARLAGSRVLQVRGALLESAAPFLDYGLADAAVDLSEVEAATVDLLRQPAPAAPLHVGDATGRVVAQLVALTA